jgi:hypothetical protein
MLYHAMQLLICAWIARRYAAGEQRLTSGVSPGAVANLVEPVSVIDHREPGGESVTVLASIIVLVDKP